MNRRIPDFSRKGRKRHMKWWLTQLNHKHLSETPRSGTSLTLVYPQCQCRGLVTSKEPGVALGNSMRMLPYLLFPKQGTTYLLGAILILTWVYNAKCWKMTRTNTNKEKKKKKPKKRENKIMSTSHVNMRIWSWKVYSKSVFLVS